MEVKSRTDVITMEREDGNWSQERWYKKYL